MTANLWWAEEQTPNLRLGFRCASVLERRRSAYQDIAVYDTADYGRLLALDDKVMTTEVDEFVYHEMLVHPALSWCASPRRVLVVGGGDGGCVREICRHGDVEHVVLAELDADVVEVSRRHLPKLAASLGDARVEVRIGDAAALLRQAEPQSFDVVLVDAPDPVGPAEVLFGPGFYRDAVRVLVPGGVLAAQSESPFLHADLIRSVQGALRGAFGRAALYWAVVPTYPGALWTFSLAVKAPWPTSPRRPRVAGTRYWSPEVQQAAAVLPPFVARLLEAEA